jgi:hypothetical protein
LKIVENLIYFEVGWGVKIIFLNFNFYKLFYKIYLVMIPTSTSSNLKDANAGIQVHNSLANIKIKENTHVYFIYNSFV